MMRRSQLILAAALAGAAGPALAQADASAALRASGKAGEQADGYLGVVGSPDAATRAQVDAVNIKRRAFYTDLAAKRGAKIEEVAATTACQILATRVQPGQYYRLGREWRKREPGAPVQRPDYCT